jgi:Domain of unknown function (DUF5753)
VRHLDAEHVTRFVLRNAIDAFFPPLRGAKVTPPGAIAIQRIARQVCLSEEPRLNFWTILDEGALRRQIGGKAVMRAQLHHLIEMSERPNVTIQVLPFAEGGHPGTLGSLVILDFPEDVHSPVAYVESFAGDAYLEKDDDLRRANMAFTHMHAAALSAPKSVEFIAAIARELA